ncbi:glycosyltransferase [Acinetobacter chinensis]|uniref:Glycosyltransferase n=1 Tax=Acinetobacter chinensis TaxID=2004650 RepID=A0ABU3WHI3_9GAMM|nr:glycosyltransferase [Acinetobacter chinensis]MDV2469864.1 glycosyltransferase [Acinetobacter chinensis]
MKNSELPLVSVIIPCYNHEKFIQESIQSVMDQTYSRMELIVIDDGSKDNSVQKIEEMRSACESRFEHFQFIFRENRGLSRTLNQGLSLAHGDYFSTVASDDIMLPEKTVTQLDVFKKDPLITAVFGAHQYIDDESKVVSVKKGAYREFSFQEIFYHQHDIPASSQMIRLSYLRDIGGYNENTKVEDWDLWLRLTESGAKLVYIPDVIVGYRMHDNNLSKDKSLMFNEVFNIVQRYKDKKGFPYAEYKVFKFYKIRPAKEKSYLLYLWFRLKYTLLYLAKSISK